MKYLIATIICLALGMCGVAMVKQSAEERKRWEAFKVNHECVIVERKDGHTNVSTAVSTGVSANGTPTTVVTPIVTSTPSQTAWECNDGVIYWRNN